MNNSMVPRPTRFHQPCWELLAFGVEYLVWAPGPISHQGRPTGKYRHGWQSAWTAEEGWGSDVAKGDTLDEVLQIFPTEIANEFRGLLGRREETSPRTGEPMTDGEVDQASLRIKRCRHEDTGYENTSSPFNPYATESVVCYDCGATL